MESSYPEIVINPRNGDERFLLNNRPIDHDLLGFWKWFGSDLTGNTARGVLAEYIVAIALGVEGGVRAEWDPFDLLYGDLSIEVKSSSYIQNWYQKGESKISFGIQRTRIWNPENNQMEGDLKRQADVYVFCVLAHKVTKTLNPMDLDQWDFYVLPTSVLNKECEFQKTVGLNRLISIGAQPIKYAELKTSIDNFRLHPELL